MKENQRYFEGYNLERLNVFIAEFKEELGDRYIGEHMASIFPKYVIVVSYHEEVKEK